MKKKNYNLYFASIFSFLIFGVLAFTWVNAGFLGGHYGFQIAVAAFIFFVFGIILLAGGFAKNH